MLAIFVIMMSQLLPLVIPLTDQSSNGVLNAKAADVNELSSIRIVGDNFNTIEEINTSQRFYLRLNLVGREPQGSYRLEIMDNNMYLGDYDGGYIDGAIHNGFPLTVKYDDKGNITERYIDLVVNGNAESGYSLWMWFQANFEDGTPNGTEGKFRLTNKSTGKFVDYTIEAQSGIYWNQNKTQDKSWLSGDALKKSATVNYTLKSQPIAIHKII